MDNDTLMVIISSAASIAALTALFISISTKRDAYYFKKFESFYQMELSKEIFIGSLNAYGFSVDEIEDDGLTINTLMYYNGLLNAIWVGNKVDNRAKRLYRRFPFLYNKVSFEKKVRIVSKMDKKRKLFERSTQTGRIIETNNFRTAWDKYLNKFWSRSSTSTTAVMIEASLANIKKH